MFTCPTCNADRSRVLPIDPCPACGAMLVTPESGEDAEPDYDPNVTIAEPPQAGYDPTSSRESTRAITSNLPSFEPKKKPNDARTKLGSLPPPPVAPPKGALPKVKSTARATPSPVVPKKLASKPAASLPKPSSVPSPTSNKHKPAPIVSEKIVEPLGNVDATKIAKPKAKVEALESDDVDLEDLESDVELEDLEDLEDLEEDSSEITEVLNETIAMEPISKKEPEVEALGDVEFEEDSDEPAIDELETVILEPPSKEVLAAKPTELSPFDADILQESSSQSSSPFDDNVSMDEVLTKTVADVSVDIDLSSKRSTPRESESTPDVFTRTVADAMPVLTPAPVPSTPTPPPSAPVQAAVSGAIVAGGSLGDRPSSALPGVGVAAPQDVGQSPSQLLPRAPSGPTAPPAITPTPPSSDSAPAAFVAPESWNAAPEVRSPDTMADIPAAYAVQSAAPVSPQSPSAMIPTPGPRVAVPTPHSGVIASGQIGGGVMPQPTPAPSMVGAMGQQMTPAPPQTIGPPPQMSAGSSYPGNALAALGEEAGPNPAGPNPANPNQVWKQAHPSAQRWAQKRQTEAPRTPKPMMIALGLILCGAGFYLLSIFLPSKAPLSAAKKLALASQAGVDENAWRFTEQLLLAANLNAGLFVFLGLVLVLRGALFRPSPNAAGKTKSGKTTILLVFCFVLLALSFAALFITGST